MLAHETFGEGPRVALVHGFTQTRTSWLPIARRLADTGYQPVLVDLPGHGASAHLDADLWETATLLRATVGEAVYVGYSLGGRVCLHLALADPAVGKAFALVGATPGLRDIGDRIARRRADEALAARLVDLGVERFLDEWLAQPLFATLQPDPADLDARRANTVAGLAASLRRAGTGTQDSLWEHLDSITAPVLAVTGERDTKFTAIAAEMVRSLPRGRHEVVASAGHAAHLEQPEMFLEVLCRWLEHVTRAS